MPPKLNFFISLLETTFHRTKISSSKIHNSNLHMFSIFSLFLLVIFLGNITLFLSLNKLLRGWVFRGAFRNSLYHPSCLLSIEVLFNPLWSMLHTSGVVPLIQLSLKRWSLRLFVSSILLLLLTLSSLFLPVELLRHFLYTIAITTDIALLNSHVAYLLHWEGFVPHYFLHSLIQT